MACDKCGKENYSVESLTVDSLDLLYAAKKFTSVSAETAGWLAGRISLCGATLGRQRVEYRSPLLAKVVF